MNAMNRAVTAALALLLGGVVIVWAANMAGLWWASELVDLIIGVLMPRTWYAIGLSCLIAALGWALPLAWQARTEPIGSTATAVSDIMGLGSGVALIVVVVLLGLLFGASGAWLGTALRDLITRPA